MKLSLDHKRHSHKLNRKETEPFGFFRLRLRRIYDSDYGSDVVGGEVKHENLASNKLIRVQLPVSGRFVPWSFRSKYKKLFRSQKEIF